MARDTIPAPNPRETVMRPYPIVLEPILKPRVWGGRGLARLGRTLPPAEPIGESWEIADLPASIPDGRSTIANGPLAGRTLREALEAHRASIMGTAPTAEDGGFPLLVKYLDARENLSVQVHPPRRYVETHPGTHVKNEAWVVIGAEPGAVIYQGVHDGVSPADFARHVADGTVVDDLVELPVQIGSCHYLPSGTVHALGAGVLVAEVQTPSDTTFRVYDWQRGRELHVTEALACIDFGSNGAASTQTAQTGRSEEPIHVDGLATTTLLDCEHFGIERVEVISEGPRELPVVTNDLPVIWMITAGGGSLRGGGVEVALRAGTTVLHPAALRDASGRLDGGCDLLQVTLPSPIRGMLAG